jgi:hypothetical protein
MWSTDLRIGYMSLFPLLALFCCAAFAQNTDLGILGGVSESSTQVVGGPGGSISSSVGGHFQINFAFQLREYKTGRLYLELPFLLGGHARTTVGPGVSASTGGNVYFTPGVRWNLPIHSRVSLYGTAGGGLVGARRNDVSVGAQQVFTSGFFAVGLAGTVGGGLDMRLSRLVSLRAEARDFISARGYDGSPGHNHVIFGFGVGFHW